MAAWKVAPALAAGCTAVLKPSELASLTSADLSPIAFTGSTATGSKIMTSAAQLVKPVTLELGGKSPIIVFDDAELDKAAEWTAFGCFCTTGQICSATSRLLVHLLLALFYVFLVKKGTYDSDKRGGSFVPIRS
ncbi:hypothetical protein KSS87_014335 [Heliosperma pusillum]|nr:hypothetical protein KSS87_014335 [Heliosperma pusillum]